jgi:hypothetical protein
VDNCLPLEARQSVIQHFLDDLQHRWLRRRQVEHHAAPLDDLGDQGAALDVAFASARSPRSPPGRFMITSRTRVVQRHPEGDWRALGRSYSASCAGRLDGIALGSTRKKATALSIAACKTIV